MSGWEVGLVFGFEVGLDVILLGFGLAGGRKWFVGFFAGCLCLWGGVEGCLRGVGEDG